MLCVLRCQADKEKPENRAGDMQSRSGWSGSIDSPKPAKSKACKKNSSASDDQAETIDPGPTAAVDACDAVAARRDKRMPKSSRNVSEQFFR
jgi:hypothetical protein